jgi:TRAP-type C4-dicarboxylate transport system permease small subunit
MIVTAPISTLERTLDRLVSSVRSLSRVAGWVCGFLLTLSALIICIDIVLRSTVVITLWGANEIAGYALAVASSWGCSVALVYRMHIRIDSLYTHLHPRLRALLDILGLVAFIYFMALVTLYSYGVLAQSISSDSHSISELETPLAVPQAVWFAGFVVFLFVAAIYLARAVVAFIKGDLRTVTELLGARSVEEEIEVEKESLGVNRRPDTGAERIQ